MANLTELETRTLQAMKDDAQDATDGDFGFMDELESYLPGLTMNQIGGVITNLIKKGLVWVDDEYDQFGLNE